MSKEREFLHDISSPLTTIQLNVENVMALLEEQNPENTADCVQMLTSCIGQLKRATDMIRERRSVLIAAEQSK